MQAKAQQVAAATTKTRRAKQQLEQLQSAARLERHAVRVRTNIMPCTALTAR